MLVQSECRLAQSPRLRVTTYRIPTQQNLAVTQPGTPFDLMKLSNGCDTTPI